MSGAGVKIPSWIINSVGSSNISRSNIMTMRGLEIFIEATIAVGNLVTGLVTKITPDL